MTRKRPGGFQSDKGSNYDIQHLYETQPDLLRKHVSEKNGKIFINMRDKDSVKSLMTAVMKTDYEINNWSVPEGHLCPMIHNRRTYIEWLNSLFRFEKLSDDINGIDIGVGATVVYPLLGYKLFKWSMLGIDTDESSIRHSQDIVTSNGLDDKIKLLHIPPLSESDSKTFDVLSRLKQHSDEKFTFCMCNPPFYDSEDVISVRKRKTTTSLTKSENSISGGELLLATTLLEESLTREIPVLWFSIMFGRKNSAKSFKKLLLKHSEEDNPVITYRSTQFILGTTTRWLFAWKLLPEKTK